MNGKPEGLRVGSIIHAIELGFEDYRLGHACGEVTRITPKGCLVQEPGVSDSRRVLCSKYVIEFIPTGKIGVSSAMRSLRNAVHLAASRTQTLR